MPNIEVKHPDKTATTGSYSAGVIRNGWLYVSGHGSLDLKTGEPIPGTVEDETRRTLQQIGKVLAAAGAGFEDIVKCSVHLADIDEFDGFDRAYREFFPGVKPARTTVQAVLWGGLKVEIDAIACLPER
ncbi:MAG TPA: RidA family protein [Bryobacteraceae bacterium]|nr:RidA family protein [Bryobacteraceae bacterium]